MQLDKPTMKKLALLVGGGIALFWLLENVDLVSRILTLAWGVVFPFILGGIFAFLLNIPMHAIETKIFRQHLPRGRRVLSFLITIVLLLLLIAMLIFLLAPQLVKTVDLLIKAMPGYILRIQESLAPFQKYVPDLQKFLTSLDWNKLGSTIFGWLQSGFGNVFSSALGVANSVVSGATSFIIALIFSVYILLDKEHIGAQLSGLMQAYIPTKRFQKIMEFLHLANRTFSRFVTGQCLEAVAIGSAYIVILSVGGFDYSLLIGVLIGFSSFIPLIGAFIGCILGALLIWVSMGFWRAFAFVVLFLVVQQLDGNFMYPRIVGTSIGLPPMWVLVAISLGGSLLGVFGMLFFIPLTSVVYILLSRSTEKRLQAKGISSPVGAYHDSRPKKPEKKEKKKKENPEK